MPLDSRTDDFFFRQSRTLDALVKLAEVRQLVIYCGAGVSIDRTGVSWRRLTKEVFLKASATQVARLQEKASIAYILENIDDVQQAGSLVIEAYASPAQTENDFLGSKLKDILYEQSGWNRGLVLRNLIQLALTAARHDRVVKILTTNYDVFIESEFLKQYDALLAKGLPQANLPGMRRVVPEVDGTRTETEITPTGSDAGAIEVVYLHGRVDERGQVEGLVVLSERSYAATRMQSSRILEEEIGGEIGLLTVGASLTDPPLVDALARTQRDSGPRYALLTVPRMFSTLSGRRPAEAPAVEITAASVGDALRARSRHLGLQVLNPIDHFQSAQFLEELRLCITGVQATGDERFYSAETNGISYAERLASWAERWESTDAAELPEFSWRVLSRTLEHIRLLLKSNDATAGEKLRVEAWVRHRPASSDRTLTLWANSDGPILDRTALRKAAIEVDADNASVRTFLQGRPQLYSLDELGPASSGSRWKTFLSVPIYVNVKVDFAGVTDYPALPIGVVTLTSTWWTGAFTDGRSESFFSKAAVSSLNDVKGALLAAGRQLFEVVD